MAPTILVVDDDPDVLQMIGAVLIDAGYRVRHAYDGLLALWEIETHPPDLVLADVRMPRLDGVALAEEARQCAPPIPVILMSATRAPAVRHWPFIAKPFDIDKLLGLVDRALRHA
jgi:DNA-binding NtrC family response regulator